MNDEPLEPSPAEGFAQSTDFLAQCEQAHQDGILCPGVGEELVERCR